jgi:hypothetical protein
LLLCAALVALAASPVLAAGEAGWPQEFKVDDTRLVFYEPQYESLEQDLLKGRAAVAITPKGRTTPILGAAWFESKVAIDRDARTVRGAEARITRVHVPDFTPEEEARLKERMARVASDLDLSTSLDRLTASLNASRNERRTAHDLKMAPPRILFESSPAFLVVLDGRPKTIRVKGTDLDRVVNTPSFIVRDSGKGQLYLRGAGQWYQAGAVEGPWRAVSDPPGDVENLWESGMDGPEGEKQAAEEDEIPAGGAVPRAIVSTEPAELIVSDGAPKFAPISGLDLLYMSNTASDVLMEVGTQSYYVLLSGRWFRSESLQGPWEHVRPDMLPESFAKIPPGSAKGDLLASVSGTPEAEEAVLDSAVPQTAVVRKSEAKLTVAYDGEPAFRPVPKTQIEYAVNTDAQVLKIRDRYYAVDQGVWFVSDSPTGPWAVADEEPPEAQEIPPDSPVYNTKYVYVYDSSPDRVYVGYLPGYLGYYPYYGTVVYGTGWYYPGWWGSAYYPYPWTWGFGAHYSTWAGWSFGFGIGFGYGWYPYSPWYAWGYPGWWGPIGWGPCYANYYYPYYPYYGTVQAGGVPVARPPRGSNTNLYRQPGNVSRVAQTRDKYAARTTAAGRGGGGQAPGQSSMSRGSRVASSGSAASNGRTGTKRPTTVGRPTPQQGMTRQTPQRSTPSATTGRSVTRPGAPSGRSTVTAPGSSRGRSTPSTRPAPPGRASSSVRSVPPGRSAPPNTGTPSARRSVAPPPRSTPPAVRSAPSSPRPSVPSFGGGGRSLGGSRSFGGGRSMGQAPRSFGGGGMGFRGGGMGPSRGGGMSGARGGGHRR